MATKDKKKLNRKVGKLKVIKGGKKSWSRLDLIQWLEKRKACERAIVWLKESKDVENDQMLYLWNFCHRGDWLCFILDELYKADEVPGNWLSEGEVLGEAPLSWPDLYDRPWWKVFLEILAPGIVPNVETRSQMPPEIVRVRYEQAFLMYKGWDEYYKQDLFLRWGRGKWEEATEAVRKNGLPPYFA